VQRLPEGQTKACRNRDLVGKFAREADPVDPHGEAAQRAVSPLHEGQRFLGNIHPAQLFQQLARIGADNGDLRQLFGDIGGVNLPIPPFALQPVFHPRMDAVCPARGGVAQPRLFVDTRNHAVVGQETLFVAHQAIAALADRKVRHHAGVKHVKELARIRPFDDDLAKGRGIEQAKVRSGVVDLAVNCLFMRLARAREGIGATPQTHRLHVGVLRFVPRMHRGFPQRLENLATGFASQRAQGDGRVGRAEGGGANLRDIFIQRLSKDRQAVDIRKFTLICRHAQRRVTLGMFDRLVTLAGGKLHVRDLHVVLVIQPHLGLQRRASALRHDPDGFHRGFGHLRRAGRLGFGLETGGLGRSSAALGGIGQGIGCRHRTIGIADRDHHGLTVLIGRRLGGIGAEMGVGGIPDQLAAAMAPQVNDRRPAARHCHRITGDFFQNRAFARLNADRHTGHALATLDLGDGTARFDADAHGARAGRQLAGNRSARVDHSRNLKPRLFQRNRGAVSVVVVGDNNRAIPRRDGKVHHIIAHRSRQHHARNVVARKGQRPFNRASGRDDPACADTPQTVLRTTIARRVVGNLFIGQNIAVVIDARAHGAVAQADIRHGLKGLDSGFHPSLCRGAFDHIAIDGRAATPMGGLLQHDDAGTGGACNQGRLQTGDTAADHQHVAEGIGLLVPVSIAVFRRFAKASGLADDRLEQVLPRGARIHEGLVIETARQEPCEGVVDHAHVEFKAGPVVLAFGLKPVEKLGRGDALVRFEPRPLAQAHKRVRLFGASGHDAARAVIFEGPAHKDLIIGQKCRGKGIALVSTQLLAVEGKFLRDSAVDQTTATGKTGAHL
jgi:hypothetical protein